MDNSDKQLIINELAAEAIYMGARVRTDYSGRGMYGNRCFGIVGDFATLSEVVLETQRTIAMSGLSIAIDVPCQDSMGLDIIWYWPMLDTSDMDVPHDL